MQEIEQKKDEAAIAREQFLAARLKRHIYRIEWARDQEQNKFIQYYNMRWPNQSFVRVGRSNFALPKKPTEMINFLYPQALVDKEKALAK